MNDASDIKAALDFAANRQPAEVIEFTDGEVTGSALLVPSGAALQVHDVKKLLAPFRSAPERREGTITADDLDSFVMLVNRDKRPESVIFARRGKLGGSPPSLLAVLDFHKPGAGAPAFGRDRIAYGFPLSEEWEAWTQHEGADHAMNQGDFAQFIEDHIFDIGEPGAAGPTTMAFASKVDMRLAGPSEMMAVSRGLEVRINSTVRNVVNNADGTAKITYDDSHTDAAGAPLSVPRAFHLLIPIFRGGALYSIPVRLRYRAATGKPIMWFYEMHRADLFYDDAINDVLVRVRNAPDAIDANGASAPGCGLPVALGAPAI